MNKRIVTVILLLVLVTGLSLVDVSGNGLKTYEAVVNGANPIVADTDNDGLDDYEEVKIHNTDPTEKDTIGNGLTDYEEVEQYGTNPLKKDTNNDGLTDYEEVKVYNTNPTTLDTDKDGLSDYEEVTDYDTDPTEKDTDNDELNDYNEVKIHGTDPSIADTDYDGLTDYEEVEQYNTNPAKEDTDNDGLNDSREITLGSNPNSKFTADDGFSDGVAVESDEINLLKRTVLVRVSYSSGVDTEKLEFSRIRELFEDAPISNYNSDNGIDVKFVVDDSPITDADYMSIRTYEEFIYEDEFTEHREGYHHIMYVPNVQRRGVVGVTTSSIEGALVQTELMNSYEVQQTTAHELGHQLGLWPRKFEGIDSGRYSTLQYDSVMNYNYDGDSIQFSENGLFNDWAEIDRSLADNNPNPTGLEP